MVPNGFLKEALCDNLELAFEVYTYGVGDTEQRSMLVDAILKKMGLRDWPMNMEGEDVFEEFILKLKETAPKFKIIFNQGN